MKNDNNKAKFLKCYNSIMRNKLLNIFSKNILCMIIQYYQYYKEVTISFTTLSEELGLSRTTIIRNIQELEKYKLITVQRERDNSKNSCNRYLVNEEKINNFFQDEIFVIKKEEPVNSNTVSNSTSSKVSKVRLPDTEYAKLFNERMKQMYCNNQKES